MASNRKLRPVFVEKKPLVEQYAWIHKTLKVKACDTIGEHLLQAYLMAGQQSLLGMFCDGMGIPHDGKGSVVGDLPKELDSERLASTIDRLVGLFNCFEAGLSTSLVIRHYRGDSKLIGWIVHRSDYNRCEAQAHRGPPGAGAWIWRPKSGMRRRRV